jgi:hypothetical protein
MYWICRGGEMSAITKTYVVSWGSYKYSTSTLEDAELLYDGKVKQGYQPSIFLDEIITTVNRTKIK